MKSDKELYRRLRGLPWDELWSGEVARFNAAAAAERLERVAVVRAVGVVAAEDGTEAQRAMAREWLRGLLRDPAEKIRRYAMAALPKLGAGEGEEQELLALLDAGAPERERRHVARALGRIGGEATLAAVTRTPGLLPQAEQKVRASVARREEPSRVRLDRTVTEFAGLLIHLRCRSGLEEILRGEVESFLSRRPLFRLVRVERCLVVLAPVAAFTLADVYSLRCFATAGLVLGSVAPATPPDAAVESVARAITSDAARRLFARLTEGAPRYRLEFVGRGHQRGGVARVAERAYALCPEILNDARSAPWAIEVHPTRGGGSVVELRPKLVPDPRLHYRTGDVAASSHPALAACLARVAGRVAGGRERVWDPFCGSGLELIECALLGGVEALLGTDVSEDALTTARANLAAAQLGGVRTEFACADFRAYAESAGSGTEGLTLIVTNPPMGRRVQVPDLHGLIADLFRVAERVLRPGGRLVFPNPVRVEPRPGAFRLRHRQRVDLGGFYCELELHERR